MNDMPNLEFAQRLIKACREHAEAPDPGRGMQAWVAQKVGVTPEAVRKWVSGQSRPRPAVMARLAEALEADVSWLSLGVTPIRDTRAQRRFVRNAAGAVYLVAGLIEMDGGHVAFRDDDHDDPDIDLHAIIDGRSLALHVATAQRAGVGRYRIAVPTQHEHLVVVGVFKGRDLTPRLVTMHSADIEEYGENRGGYVEIEVLTDDADFVTEEHSWPQIVSFRCPLSEGRAPTTATG